jgi:hypothetical protein
MQQGRKTLLHLGFLIASMGWRKSGKCKEYLHNIYAVITGIIEVIGYNL